MTKRTLTKRSVKVALKSTIAALVVAVFALSGFGIYFALKDKAKGGVINNPEMNANPISWSIDKWNGSSSSGTEFKTDYAGRGEDSKTIDSAASFIYFVNSVNEGNTYEGKTVYLNKNIDLGGYKINSIGSPKHPFKGTFDGGYYTIMNANIVGTGFFGYTDSAEIKNVGLYNVNVENESGFVGGLVGTAVNTNIADSFVRLGSVKGNNFVGGLVGLFNSNNGIHTIENSFVDSLVTGKRLGGLVSNISTNNSNENQVKILNCYYKLDTSSKSVSANGNPAVYKMDNSSFVVRENVMEVSDKSQFANWNYTPKYEDVRTNCNANLPAWCDYSFIDGSFELSFDLPILSKYVKVYNSGTYYESTAVNKTTGEVYNIGNLSEAVADSPANELVEFNIFAPEISVEETIEVNPNSIVVLNPVVNTTIKKSNLNIENIFTVKEDSSLILGERDGEHSLVIDGNKDDVILNEKQSGAVILSHNADVQLFNNVVIKNNINNLDGFGGGIAVVGGNGSETLNLEGGKVENCEAQYGGGIAILGGTAVVNTDISNCKAEFGGGLYVGGSGNATSSLSSKLRTLKNPVATKLDNTTIVSDYTVTSTISGGSAANGGGIYVDFDSTAVNLRVDTTGKIINCNATNNGGAVCLRVQDQTHTGFAALSVLGEIYSNSATKYGGGVGTYLVGEFKSSAPRSSMSISGAVHDNTAQFGGGISAFVTGGYRIGVTSGISTSKIYNNTATNSGNNTYGCGYFYLDNKSAYVYSCDAIPSYEDVTFWAETVQSAGDLPSTRYYAGSRYAVVSDSTIGSEYSNQTMKRLYSWSTGSSVMFNANGGNGTKTIEVSQGEEFTVPDFSGVTRAGYTVDTTGWYANSDGTGTKYTVGSTYTKNDNSTLNLYAKWTAMGYTVTLNAVDDSMSNEIWPLDYGERLSEVTVVYASAMPSVTVPAKEGYTFEGYFYNGIKYINGDGTSAKNWNIDEDNVTLTGSWTPKVYRLTFNKAGGAGGSDYVDASYNRRIPSISYPTKTGYIFDGYYYGNTQYIGSTSDGYLRSTGNKTLTAQWSPVPYHLQLDSTPTSGSTYLLSRGTTSVTAVYGSSMAEIVVPERDGYSFAGYYYNGVKYYNANGTSAHAWDVTDDVTLTGVWTANTYRVTFDKNGGTGGTNYVDATFDAALNTITIPTRSGYFFGGYYYAGSSGTDAASNSNRFWNDLGIGVLPMTIPGDVTLKAYWGTDALISSDTGLDTADKTNIVFTSSSSDLPAGFDDIKTQVGVTPEGISINDLITVGTVDNTVYVYFPRTSVIYAPVYAGSLFYGYDGTSLDLTKLRTDYTTNMSSMFACCYHLTNLDLSLFNTNRVRSVSGMFSDCSSLTSLDLSSFNTSNVADMSQMFDNCINLTTLNLSNFNTSNVTTMSNMFDNCSSLTSITFGSNFNTSKVTTMSNMFYRCSSLTSLDLSSFNTSNATNMSWMFYECSGLTSLDLSSFNTSNVTSMSSMFYECSGLTSITFGNNFSTSNVTHISGMFTRCSRLTSLDLSSFDTSNVTTMSGMFIGCSGLTSLDLSSFNTSNATNMSYMFGGCSGLTSLDLSSFNTSNATNMSSMFSGCSGLTSLDLSSFNTSKVSYMDDIFGNCTNLTTLNLSGWDLRALSNKSLSAFFNGRDKLTSIDLSNWKTSNITNMYLMFQNCSSLTSLDLSSFDTSSVTNMGGMFQNCSSLTSITFGNNFNTSNVTNMSSMFNRCSSLTSLDLSSFDTSSVTNMSSMFIRCSSLTSITFGSNFNTCNVTDMSYMFYNCSGLTSLDLSSFDMSSVTDASSMLSDCSSVDILTVPYNVGNITIQLPGNFYIQSTSELIGNVLNSSNCRATTSEDCETYVRAGLLQPFDNSVYIFVSRLSKYKTLTELSFVKTLPNGYENMDSYNIGSVLQNDDSVGPNAILYVDGTIGYVYSQYDMNLVGDGESLHLYSLASISFENIDTSLMTNMSGMFSDCSSLTSLDLSSFDTSSVTDMSSMFTRCSSLTSITFGNNFNTSNVINMSNMFDGCSALTTLNLSSFNTSNVTYMSYMFYNCSSLTSLDLSSFDVSNIETPVEFLSGTTSLTSLKVPYNFNSHSIQLPRQFYNEELTTYYLSLTSSNCSATSSEDCITIYSSDYFEILNNSAYLGGVNSSNWMTINGVSGSYYAKELYFVNELPTGYENMIATNIGYPRNSSIFGNAGEHSSCVVEYLDISDADNIIQYIYSPYDIYLMSNFGIYNGQYYKTISFGNSNISLKTDLSRMFENFTALETIDLGSWDTSSVTNMSSMFSGCSSLVSINLSSFDLSSLSNANYMFYGTTALDTIVVPYNLNTTIDLPRNFYKPTTLAYFGNALTYSNCTATTSAGCITVISARLIPITDNKVYFKMLDLNTITGIEEIYFTSTRPVGYESMTSYNAGYRFRNSDYTTNDIIAYVDVNKLYVYSQYDIYLDRTESGRFPETVTTFGFDNFHVEANTNLNYLLSGLSLDSVDLSASNFANATNSNIENMFRGSNILSIKMPYNISSSVTLYMPREYYDNETNAYLGDNISGSLVSATSSLNAKTIVQYSQVTVKNNTVYVDLNYLRQDNGGYLSLPTYSELHFVGTRPQGYENMTTFNVGKLIYGDGIRSMPTNDAAVLYIDETAGIAYVYSQYTMALTRYITERNSSGLSRDQYRFNFENLTSVTFENIDTSLITDMSYMFYGCGATTLNLSLFNTSNVTTMGYMFDNCSNLTTLNLSSFNTSNVTTMGYMFDNCSNLTTLNLSSFNTSNVRYMSYMFGYCSNLTSLDLSAFNTSNVTDMSYMFAGCSDLTSITFGNNFNTGNVTNMSFMFYECSGLTSLDLSSFNTSNVTRMSYMFSNCSRLTSLNLSNFNTSNVTNMSYMFYGCSGLTSLDLSSFDLSNIDTYYDSIYSANHEFELNRYYRQSYINDVYTYTLLTEQPEDWGTAYYYVRYYSVENMFSGCSSLNTITVPYNLPSGMVISLPKTFYNLTNNALIGTELNSSNCRATRSEDCETYVTEDLLTVKNNKIYVFLSDLNSAGSGSLTELHFVSELPAGHEGMSSYNIGRVINSSSVPEREYAKLYVDGTIGYVYSQYTMYLIRSENVSYNSERFDSSLTAITFGNINTSEITNMSHMFDNCSNLTSLDLSNFSTSNVTDMSDMFYGCSNLTTLDLTSFNTSNVTGMYSMFGGCQSLTSLDLSSFNTSNVTNMSSMFSGCSSLTSITFGNNFNTNNVTDMSDMFYNCSSLTSLDLSSFNLYNIGIDYTSINSANCEFELNKYYRQSYINGSSVYTLLEEQPEDWGTAYYYIYRYKVDDMLEECSNLESITIPSYMPNRLVLELPGYYCYNNSFYTEINASDFNTSVTLVKAIIVRSANIDSWESIVISGNGNYVDIDGTSWYVIPNTQITFSMPSYDTSTYEFLGWYSSSEYSSETLLTTSESYTFTPTVGATYYYFIQSIQQYSLNIYGSDISNITAYDLDSAQDINLYNDNPKNAWDIKRGTNVRLTVATYDGYDFLGWYTYNTQTGEYGELLSSNITYDLVVNGDIYLYAKVGRTCVVTSSDYNSRVRINNLTTSEEIYSGQTVSVGDQIEFTIEISDNNFEFVGWYSDRNYTNFVSSDTSYTITAVYGENALYAKVQLSEEAVTYNISIIVNNSDYGSWGYSNIYVDNETSLYWAVGGSHITVDAYPNWDSEHGRNYVFAGWYSDSNYENLLTLSLRYEDYSISNDLTLYALFRSVELDENSEPVMRTVSILDTSTDEGVSAEVQISYDDANGDRQYISDFPAQIPDGSRIYLELRSCNGSFNGFAVNGISEYDSVIASRDITITYSVSASVDPGPGGQTYYFNYVYDDTMGSVDSNYESGSQVGEGSYGYLKASPLDGYTFLGWYLYDETQDVLTLLSRDLNYEISINQDTTIHANFRAKTSDTRTITFIDESSVENSGNYQVDIVTYYNAGTSNSNAIENFTNPYSIADGTMINISFFANQGYFLNYYTVNGNSRRIDPICVNEDITIRYAFTPIFPLTFTVNVDAYNNIEGIYENPETLIYADGTQLVDENGVYTLTGNESTITIYSEKLDNFKFISWMTNGEIAMSSVEEETINEKVYYVATTTLDNFVLNPDSNSTSLNIRYSTYPVYMSISMEISNKYGGDPDSDISVYLDGVEIKEFGLSIESENTQITLTANVKDGYSFDGWYFDINGATDNAVKIIGKSEAEGLGLYCTYANGTYSVTFSLSQLDQSLLSNNNYIRALYVEGEEQSSGLTLRKVGGGESCSLELTEQDGVKSIIATATEYYNFAGWYLDAECTQELISIDSCTNSNNVWTHILTNLELSYFESINLTTLYGKFEVAEGIAPELRVVGDGAEAAGCTLDIEITNDRIYIVATAATGYTFAGWYMDQACSSLMTSDARFDVTDLLDQAPEALYGKFEAEQVSGPTLSVVGDGAESAGCTLTTQLDGDNVILVATAANGYTFIGWYADQACEHELISLASCTQNGNVWTHQVTESEMTYLQQNGITTLYGKFESTEQPWEGNPIGVRVTGTNGTATVNEKSSDTFDYSDMNQSFTYVATANDGYAFSGWSFYSNGSTLIENAESTFNTTLGDMINMLPNDVTPDNNGYVVIYAIFEEEQTPVQPIGVRVTGTNGTVTVNEKSSDTFNYSDMNQSFTYVATANDGYAFSGWSFYSNGSALIENAESTFNTTLGDMINMLPDDVSPDNDGYIVIYAIFEEEQTPVQPIGVRVTGTNGTVTINGSSSANFTGENDQEFTYVATANDGYQLVGWSFYPSGSPLIDGAGSTFTLTFAVMKGMLPQDVAPDNDGYIVIYAFFEEITYTVTIAEYVDYNNGINGILEGDDLITSKTVSEGTTISLIAIANDGYTFEGWFVDGNSETIGTGDTFEDYTIGSNVYSGWILEYEVNGNVTLRAKFVESQVGPTQPIGVRVTGTNGTVTINGSSSANFTGDDDQEFTYVATANDGYQLVGWSFYPSGSPLIDGAGSSFTLTFAVMYGMLPNDVAPDNDGYIVIYAFFEESTYSITYHDGSTHANPETFTVSDLEITLVAPTSYPNGYNHFDGWYDNSSYEGSPITQITEIGNKEFWAKWSNNSVSLGTITNVTVQYTIDGENWIDMSSSFDFVIGQTYSFRAIPDSNYNLSTFTITKVVPNEQNIVSSAVSNVEFETGYDYVVDAIATAETYTVTFNSNGGSINPAQETGKVVGSTITLPDPGTKTGYAFAGWFDNSTNVGSIGNDYTVTGNTALTAHWTANSYNITYVLDDGINPEVKPITYTIENSAKLPIPTKQYYSFVGWRLTSAEGSVSEHTAGDNDLIYSIPANSYGDVELTAVWGWELNLTVDNGTSGVKTINNLSFYNATEENVSDKLPLGDEVTPSVVIENNGVYTELPIEYVTISGSESSLDGTIVVESSFNGIALDYSLAERTYDEVNSVYNYEMVVIRHNGVIVDSKFSGNPNTTFSAPLWNIDYSDESIVVDPTEFANQDGQIRLTFEYKPGKLDSESGYSTENVDLGEISEGISLGLVVDDVQVMEYDGSIVVADDATNVEFELEMSSEVNANYYYFGMIYTNAEEETVFVDHSATNDQYFEITENETVDGRKVFTYRTLTNLVKPGNIEALIVREPVKNVQFNVSAIPENGSVSIVSGDKVVVPLYDTITSYTLYTDTWTIQSSGISEDELELIFNISDNRVEYNSAEGKINITSGN